MTQPLCAGSESVGVPRQPRQVYPCARIASPDGSGVTGTGSRLAESVDFQVRKCFFSSGKAKITAGFGERSSTGIRLTSSQHSARQSGLSRSCSCQPFREGGGGAVKGSACHEKATTILPDDGCFPTDLPRSASRPERTRTRCCRPIGCGFGRGARWSGGASRGRDPARRYPAAKGWTARV